MCGRSVVHASVAQRTSRRSRDVNYPVGETLSYSLDVARSCALTARSKRRSTILYDDTSPSVASSVRGTHPSTGFSVASSELHSPRSVGRWRSTDGLDVMGEFTPARRWIETDDRSPFHELQNGAFDRRASRTLGGPRRAPPSRCGGPFEAVSRSRSSRSRDSVRGPRPHAPGRPDHSRGRFLRPSPNSSHRQTHVRQI